ncbi:MAG: hypothetical protein EOP50_11260 [Sphingobacteriales bacterium]|nr:MAG: hypothetical protein EOP50_11260 [Sphingobacteriales bacterium]
MRSFPLALTVITALTWVACENTTRPPVKKTEAKPPAADTTPYIDPPIYNDTADSLRLLPVLDSALAWTLQQRAARFRHEYETMTNDSLWNVHVSLAQGPILVSNRTHLEVKVNTPGAVEIRFYERSKGHFRLLLKADTDEPVSDTLRDVNGDGITDFLLSDYSSAGCCPRERWHVWCYLPATGALAGRYSRYH